MLNTVLQCSVVRNPVDLKRNYLNRLTFDDMSVSVRYIEMYDSLLGIVRYMCSGISRFRPRNALEN